MNKHILMPAEPTQEMLSSAMAVCTGFSGDYGRYNDHLSEDAAREVYQAFRSVAPAVQAEPVGWQFYEDGRWWNGDDRIKDHRKNTEAAGVPVRDVYAAPQPTEQREPVASAPVAAQQRFRHTQKSTRDWSAWQPASINLDRPSWEIDSQGFEVEYRLLYAAQQPISAYACTVPDDCETLHWRGQILSMNELVSVQPTACVGCEGSPAPENLPCAVCGQQSATGVSALVEALEWLRGAINATPENDKVQDGIWISTKHPRIKQIDAILATYRKQGDE